MVDLQKMKKHKNTQQKKTYKENTNTLKRLRTKSHAAHLNTKLSWWRIKEGA